VDGKYAEVKASDSSYGRLGFIGLTDAQYRALKDGIEFSIFVVCNAKTPELLEIIEFDSKVLLPEKPKVECTYYWYRSQLERCRSVVNPNREKSQVGQPLVIVAPGSAPGGDSPMPKQSNTGSISARIRRLAGTADAHLYVGFSKSELSRANLQHGQRVELDLNGKAQIVGTVKTSGSTPWLAPGEDTSNAAIDTILRRAGFSYGDDVPSHFRAL
jgi:hypothetical protein